MLIVTDKCYIEAESIQHVTINEEENYRELRGGKLKTIPYYQIHVHYTKLPTPQGLHGREEQRFEIACGSDLKECNRLYKEIIHQIREQKPDKDYMDKLIEEHLTGDK